MTAIPDAELRIAVMEKLGYHVGWNNCSDCSDWQDKDGNHYCDISDPPDFTTSVDACEPVKKWLREHGYDIVVRHYIDEVGVELWLRGSPIFVDVRSKDYPNAESRALCIAFMEVEE